LSILSFLGSLSLIIIENGKRAGSDEDGWDVKKSDESRQY